MQGEPVISVRGEATLEVEPDIAVVAIEVMARGRDRRDALRRLEGRRSKVREIVASCSEAVEKVEGGAVHVMPEFAPGKPKERVARYVARSSFRATVGEFTRLTELVSALLAEDLASVDGPYWSLRHDNPAHHDARLAAAQDAMRRVRDYATAFGTEVTGLVEVGDVGLLGGGEERGAVFAAARHLAADEGPVQFDFTPVPQTVRAQIEARFAVRQPDWGAGPVT